MAAVRSLPFQAAQAPEKGRFARIRENLARIKAPAALRNLASMPLTVAGLGVVDWGIFTQTVTGGLIFAGLALIGLEYLIADGD